MIKLSILAIILLFSGYRCSQHQQTATNTAVPLKVDSAVVVDTVAVDLIKTDSIERQLDFATDVQPILQSRCVPCHFPGGKMYDRMPFDNPQTLRDHSEGILRRIKGEEESKKIKDFLAQKQ